MKKQSLLLTTALVMGTLTLPATSVFANLPFSVNGQIMPSLAPMLETTAPAVVSISVNGTHEISQRVPDAFKFFFGNPRQSQPQARPFQALGSGVIINAEKGYVITNNHVVDEADEILITLTDGRQFKAKKLGSDKASDIALLEIDAEKLTAIKLADSDTIRIGDFAVAIGNPFGLGQTVTSGIVSALGRTGLNSDNYEDFIQTDAAINSGNSGGALVNLRGELIGINTAIIGPNGGNVGIGFAIPSNMMNNLATQIIEFGEVRRGVLGVSGGSVTSEIAKAMELGTNQGGFIQQVVPDSAADIAGIKAGDVIIKVNGQEIISFNELRGKIGSIGAGKEVQITVVRRNGDEKEFTVKLQKAQDANIAAASIHPVLEGSELENRANNGEGIDVSKVTPNSPAFRVGLKAGDIITGINRKRINNIAELRDQLKDQKGVFALNILRGSSNLYLMIR